MGGFSITARSSSATLSGKSLSRSCSPWNTASSGRAACSSGSADRLMCSRVRSRGRAERSATRPRIRSISPIRSSTWRADSKRQPSRSAAMRSWRSPSTERSRSGRCTQRLSNRDPIAVSVLSSTQARDGSSWPVRVSVSSRLRRVAASMATPSSNASRVSPVTWGRSLRWVSRAYCNSAPAAATDAGVGCPKPDRSCTWNCWQSCRRAPSASKSQGGRCRQPGRWLSGPGRPWSSLINSSAGCQRSSSACSCS